MKDHVEINGNPFQAALAAENIQRLLGGRRGPAVEKERRKEVTENMKPLKWISTKREMQMGAIQSVYR